MVTIPILFFDKNEGKKKSKSKHSASKGTAEERESLLS